MNDGHRQPVRVIVLIGSTALAAGVLWWSLGRGSASGDLAQTVTIRFDDTGGEVRMNRGNFERSVLARAFREKTIDPSIGLTNPSTGKPTGFPVDREYWERLVRDAEAARDRASRADSPVAP